MELTRRKAIQTVGLALTGLPLAAQTQEPGPLTLWYRKPAANWEREALPVGNGNLGAMVFGGVPKERIQLNEHSLWSGHREDIDSPQTLEYLPKVRQLFFEGKYAEANQMAARSMIVRARTTPAAYQTLGDLTLEFRAGNPRLGDKVGPSFMPVSIQDYRGHELVRGYTDEWGQYNINVNCVCPGVVDTPMVRRGLDAAPPALDAKGH